MKAHRKIMKEAAQRAVRNYLRKEEEQQIQRALRAEKALTATFSRSGDLWLAHSVEAVKAAHQAERYCINQLKSYFSIDSKKCESLGLAILERCQENTIQALKLEFEHALRCIHSCRTCLQESVEASKAIVQAVKEPSAGGTMPAAVLSRQVTEAWATEHLRSLETEAERYTTIMVRTSQGFAWAKCEDLP
eukprot:TRINITY_DN24340_c0_g1_i1.p1 TRINITY_DN24340_c0_g1~~TRINITY_DN24340_c0_g1_i1.p1  ORF type:complete len:191 (-),score=37.65 TRINITY_DN24340_c0_g1_i1:189-761(-)